HQANLTFAIARHAVVDLASVFNIEPQQPSHDRLPEDELIQMRAKLRSFGIFLKDGDTADEKLKVLRDMYEPYVNSLSKYLLMPLPAWDVSSKIADNWQTSAWERVAHV